MRTLMMGMLFCLVSGDAKVSNVTGFVGRDVLLPCTCSNRDSKFRWQADESVLVVEHTGDPSDLRGEYKDRAELSEDSSNCSLLLKNITLEDEGKYRCSFKDGGGQHHYFDVNLTVSRLLLVETGAGDTDEIFAPSPEPTPPGNKQTLWLVMPVALVAVLSLFLFFLYKRKVSGRLNAGEEEKALRIPV